jgi:hypothetical protein
VLVGVGVLVLLAMICLAMVLPETFEGLGGILTFQYSSLTVAVEVLRLKIDGI